MIGVSFAVRFILRIGEDLWKIVERRELSVL